MGFKRWLALPFAELIVFKNTLWKKNAIRAQKKIMLELIKTGKKTVFGKEHSFSKIKNYSDFKRLVPIRKYEEIEPYIKKIISGKDSVLWPGKPIYFTKTSGTTSGSKYIPISKESMPNHILAARDAILSYIAETKDTSIVDGKMIFLQGSPELSKTGNILTGRLSGIVAHHIPSYLKKNRLPTFKTNSIADWEKKIDAIVNETISKKMSLISGIPPWVQMYFEKLTEKSGLLIKDLFPSFNLFIYGGVNYEPYKKSFERLIGKKINSVELYPASEGFIAYQDSQKEKGLLLCVNHGIFYEFIAADNFLKKKINRVSLEGVQVGINYVIILNTNAGLWGYNIGDTIKFVSLDPYKIIVTGRIAHFTSAFGEHVIAEEIENALQKTIEKMPAVVKEFHVAPQVNPKSGLPYHEWLVEFEKQPKDIDAFKSLIDSCLQQQNNYYKDLIFGKVLRPLELTIVKKDGFKKYMSSVGKLGGQNKVPRLANDRNIADQII